MEGRTSNKIGNETEKEKKNDRNAKKQNIRIRTWNVRTMFISVKMEEIVSQLKIYKIIITAIQEVRWEG